MSQPPMQPYQGGQQDQPYAGQGGYPGQQGGYPGQQGGYPGQQGGYPGQQGGYPGQQGGYPGQQDYPGQQVPPQYPQQGYPGQQPYGDQPGTYQSSPPPPPKKSNAGKIVLIVLAVLAVLCVGGGAIAYVALKDTAEGIVDAATTKLEEPETLAGRSKITDENLQQVAQQMKSSLNATIPDATSTVGAFYGDPAKQDMIMIAGASGVVLDPEKELDNAITGMSSGGLTVNNLESIEPGPLGGYAKCGDASASGVDMGVCAWADNGSVGVIVVYFASADDAKKEFVEIRSAVETRS